MEVATLDSLQPDDRTVCSPVGWLRRGLVLISILLASLASAQQTRVLKGLVQTIKSHQAVVATKVGIHGVVFQKTSNEGDFALSIPAEMQAGYPITFYVEGWVIVQPSYNGVDGMVPLPADKTGDVILLVAKPGEKAVLLDGANVKGMLLGATHGFEKLRDLRQQGLIRPGNPEMSPDDERIVAKQYFQAWLDDRSAAIGISEADIDAAISSWTDHATTGLDRGLGLLYAGKIKEAINQLESSIPEHQSQESDSAGVQALSFAYSLLGDYAHAATLLNKTIDKTGHRDPTFMLHLGHVLILDKKPYEADQIFKEANALRRINGG